MLLPGKMHLPGIPRRRLPARFDLSAISVVEGVRAGLAAAVPIGIGFWLNRPDYSLAALGALLTCICDPVGPMGRRLRLLVAFAALGGLLLAGFGVLRAAGIATTVVAAAPALFICAYLRVWGQAGQALGNLLAVVLLLGADKPLSLAQAASVAALFAAGGLWALVLTIVIWRIHPYGPARRAVADVWAALAAQARVLQSLSAGDAGPEAWAREARIGRGNVRACIEYGRTVLMDTLHARGAAGGTAAQNLLRLEAADQVFFAMIGLADMLEQADPPTRHSATGVLRRLRALLVVLARATERDRLDRLQRFDRTLTAVGTDPALDPCLRTFAVQLSERLRLATKFVDPAQYNPGTAVQGDEGVPLREQVTGPLQANLTWHSATLRHAARIAAVVTPALAVTLIWHGTYTHWVTITLVLVMQPFFAITWQHSLKRVGGALLGGAVALVLSLAVRTRAHMAGLLPVFGALALAVRQVNYGVYIAVYTPTVILLVENTHPAGSFWRMALFRGGFSVLGGLLAVAANILLWPSWEPDRVRADLQAAVAAHAAYASAVLNPSPDHDAEQARRAAGLASNNLEASLARAMQEPRRGQRTRFEAAFVADAALRRVAGRLIAISLAGAGGGPVARWVVVALAALAARGPLPPRPLGQGAPMLDRLARQVELLNEVLVRAA
jgi:uncharacterized membrane protein YccC